MGFSELLISGFFVIVVIVIVVVVVIIFSCPCFTYRLTGDKMLVFGGFGGAKKVLNDLWLYDFKTATWTEVQDATSDDGNNNNKPNGRYGFGAFVNDKEFCVFGGFDGKTVWNDSWTLHLGEKKLQVRRAFRRSNYLNFFVFVTLLGSPYF